MSESHSSSSHGAAWAALIIGIIALILTVIIWIFYFLERENFLRVIEPEWAIFSVSSSDKTIEGANFSIYSIPSSLEGDTVTLNKPSSIKQGQWFIVTNLADKAVKVVPGSGVTFQSFPTTTSTTSTLVVSTPTTTTATTATTTPPIITESDLPGKTSWIVAWTDSSGTALNLVPGGITQS